MGATFEQLGPSDPRFSEVAAAVQQSYPHCTRCPCRCRGRAWPRPPPCRFDPALNQRWSYGKGTYFATAAAYSRAFAKPGRDDVSYMLVCRVVVGALCRGTNGAELDTSVHDNFVDHIGGPHIYVTPYADGALPVYVVAFHATAAQ